MSAWESIEASVVEVLADVLEQPAATLVDHPVLAAYRWDSVRSLEAFARMERRLQVRLDLHKYHEARTINDLTGLVMSAVAAKATR